MDSVQTTLTLCDLDQESTGNNFQELTVIVLNVMYIPRE